MTMWINIPCKNLESEQNKCHTVFLTFPFLGFRLFFVPYCSLFCMNVQLFGCLTSKIVFCWTFSFDSSDTALMLPLTNSSVSTNRCRSRVVALCTNAVGSAAIACCRKPTHVSCCYKRLNALCSVGCSERTCGMYQVSKRKWRRKQEALSESLVQPMGTKVNWKKIYKKRNGKRTTKMIMVLEPLPYMGKLTRTN